MFGASWGTDDAIIFSRSQLGLFRVSAAGGTPEVIAAPDLGKGEEGRYGAEMILVQNWLEELKTGVRVK